RAPPFPGTATRPRPPTPARTPPLSPIAPVAPWPDGFLPGDPGPHAGAPAPAAPGAMPAEAAPASARSYGGNVGPVGSQLERDQLSYITGAPATTATQLLMAPVVRGMTVSPGEGA
ncbi:MAG: mammalian cell entry protein, partial [Mycobacterium sp.]|nr:mammalian cell entry protein [Mycobacterium sp.]